jgi:PAS domain S-box-containing protein
MPIEVHPGHFLVDAHLVIGGITFFIGILHLFMAWRGIRRDLHLPFFIACFLAAGESFTGPGRLLSTTVHDAVFWWKLAWVFMLPFGAALVWFARAFSRSGDRRIPILLSAALAMVLAVDSWLPFGLRFREMPSLEGVRLPWGETINVLVGVPHPAFLPIHVVIFCVMAYLAAACIRLWRAPDARRDAWLLTVALAPLLLVVYPHGFLVNRGWVKPPTYYAFSFVAAVAVMSFALVTDAIRSRSLAGEVESKERRWRSLLDGLSLLAVRCDAEGLIEYVNPCLLRTTDFGEAELLGKPWEHLVPRGELQALRELFQASPEDAVNQQVQTGLITRSAEARQVIWGTILLRSPEGRIEGTLAVGSDVTDKVQALHGRDRALQELAALKEQLEAENQYLKLEYLQPIEKTDLIGESNAIRYVLHKISQAAPAEVTVILEGETGVGKELVARAIHRGSPRSKMPFIRVNCAALPVTLIESELFGHEKGSFTGADRRHQGRFELAEGGTLFLDEIGELPLDVQAKLLRVLEEGEFDRVGGTTTRKADVRLITATNRNLRREVEAGRFREDLYFRLFVLPITIPPLRERRDDIPLLIEHFTHALSRKHGRSITEIPVKLVRTLTACDWPGNVRELENVIERAVITSRTETLALPEDFVVSSAPPAAVSNGSLSTLAEMEANHILQVLEHTRGRISGDAGAAQILGMNPNTLRSRMSKLGIGRTDRGRHANIRIG